MPSEPTWLDAGLVTQINAELVALTGEPFFVRDSGLLESALARPHNHWSYGDDDMASLATALLVGIVRNHPFGQGNKRTALTAAEAFLHANGWELLVPDRTAFGDHIVELITGDLDEGDFAELLREHSRRR
ncbi:MAG: death on curing protein [Sphingomonadales bacterium]|nr:death on curing protein [Sphingomonadales bacterium]